MFKMLICDFRFVSWVGMFGGVRCSMFPLRVSCVEIDGGVDQVALEVVLRAVWFIVDASVL